MSTPSTQESYTFTLTGTNITPTEQAKINEKICRMIEDSLNSKLEGFKTKLANISDAVINQTESGLMEKMKDVFIQSFNKKLDEFKQYIVENQKSDELMQQIIYELGIKFDDALTDKQDSNYAEVYAKFVKFMEAEKEKEELGPRKDNSELTEKNLRELQELQERAGKAGPMPLTPEERNRLDEYYRGDSDSQFSLGGSKSKKQHKGVKKGGRKTMQNKTKRKKQNKTKRKKQNKTKRKK